MTLVIALDGGHQFVGTLRRLVRTETSAVFQSDLDGLSGSDVCFPLPRVSNYLQLDP